MHIRYFTFKIKIDDRGSLVAVEASKDIPFEIKRVYYIFKNKENVIRGLHAHKILKQILICLNGSCVITVDDGKDRIDVSLHQPNIGLYIGPGVWREMKNFSHDSVLLVLASEYFDDTDYIRNYQEYIKYINTFNRGDEK